MIDTLLTIVDDYKRAAGVAKDQTVSSRVFADSKRVGALRAGAGITVGRYLQALDWFRRNWPAGAEVPAALRAVPTTTAPEAAE